MKLIVGLGNPGPKYETTRHNIGFLCLDYLIDELKATGPAVKHKAEVWQAKIDGEPALLIKPLTFMNLSGQAVAPFFQFYKCTPQDLIVIYDELDLAPLDIRFKEGGTSTHNGIKSIDESIGADNVGYTRVRLGIGHPRNFNMRMDVADYVLGKIPDHEWNELEPLFKDATQGIQLILKGNILQAMNKFHGRVKPSQDK